MINNLNRHMYKEKDNAVPKILHYLCAYFYLQQVQKCTLRSLMILLHALLLQGLTFPNMTSFLFVLLTSGIATLGYTPSVPIEVTQLCVGMEIKELKEKRSIWLKKE